MRDPLTGALAPVAVDLEYGILLEEKVIVGPGWESVADVVDSFHAFGVNRVYGQLVVRTERDPQWLPHPR